MARLTVPPRIEEPEPLAKPEFSGGGGNDLRWSSDKTQIYFVRGLRNFWSLSVTDGAIRQLTDFRSRYGRLGRDFATDGEYFYYTWVEETGDIWVMDVETGE